MTHQDQIRVLIVDDHDMLREGLIAFLKAFPDLKLVGEATGGTEAIRLCRELQPDVVLMDLQMPEMDGVTATKIIRQECPQIQVIALSSFGEDELVKSTLSAGATGYLLKNVSATKLADAIRSTKAGLSTFAPEVTQALVNTCPQSTSALSYDLTPRELEVLDLLVDGLTNSEIARWLNISKFTVKNYVSNILAKLGVASRTGAVSLALQQRLVHRN